MWRRALSQCGRTILTTFGIPMPKFVHTGPSPSLSTEEPPMLTRIWMTLRTTDADPAFKHRPYVTGWWTKVFAAPDLTTSLHLLQQRRSRLSDNLSVQDVSDHWIIARLLRRNIRSVQDVLSATHLVTHGRSQFPVALQPTLIVLTAFWAIKFKTPACLDVLLETFMRLERCPPPLLYNMLLITLSSGIGGRENTMRAERLIEWGVQRGRTMFKRTSLALLRPRFATLVFAQKMKAHMEARQMELSLQHHEALLAIAIRSGNKTLSSDYSAALHDAIVRHDQARAVRSALEDGEVQEEPMTVGDTPTQVTHRRGWKHSSEYLAERRARKLARHYEQRATFVAQEAEIAARRESSLALNTLFEEQERHSLKVHSEEESEEIIDSGVHDLGDLSLIQNDSLRTLYLAERKAAKTHRRSVMKQARVHGKALRKAELKARKVSNEAWRATRESGTQVPERELIKSAIHATTGWRKSLPTLIQRFRRTVTTLNRRDTLGLYTMLSSTLTQADKFSLARRMWRELRHIGRGRLDDVVLVVGINTLARWRKAATIFKVIETVYAVLKRRARRARWAKRTRRRSSARKRLKQPLFRIDTPIISRFLLALSNMERVDAFFTFWDNMEFLYKIRPDTYALNIMLRTARRSKRFTFSMSGISAQMGLARFLPQFGWTPDDDIANPRTRWVVRFHRILATAPKQTGLWNGEPGYRRGLYIASHTILASLPQLLAVRSPVQALRNSADSIASNPLAELTATMRTYSQSQEVARPSRLLQWIGEPSAHLADSTLSPTDITFREYIHLLASNDLSSDIALVLAWMRELDVSPSRHTLAFALAYWREVALDAPLVEAMKGGDEWSPYGRLVKWLQQWVQEDTLPTDGDIGDAMRHIDAMRKYGYYEPPAPDSDPPTTRTQSSRRTRGRMLPRERMLNRRMSYM